MQVQRLANLLAQRGGKLSPQFYAHIRYNKSSNSSNSNSSGSSSTASLNAGASSSAANASSSSVTSGVTAVQAAAANGSSNSSSDAAVAAQQSEDYMPRAPADGGWYRPTDKYSEKVFTDLINVEGYHVSEHIIGPGGENIKKIMDTCKGGVALRLRGQGSAFLEGPAKVEAPEAMHVLISSADQQKVALAAKELKQLLAQLKVCHASQTASIMHSRSSTSARTVQAVLLACCYSASAGAIVDSDVCTAQAS
eukprot:6000-Heterococcus_DN1.PRE.1